MTSNELQDQVIRDAVSYEGYRALQQKVSDFGAAVGYSGFAWDGSFIETVFRRNGVTGEPSTVSTVAALGEYTRKNRTYRKPRVGDIAFYNFSTDTTFGHPHVGIVTDTNVFKDTGQFIAIEAQVSSGKPLGPQSNDGVFLRVRSAAQVIAFARPRYREAPKTVSPATVPYFRVSQLQPGKTSKATITWQLALHEVNGATGMEKGRFDRVTQAATAVFQRASGEVNGQGTVTERTIASLAEATGYKYFRFNSGVDTDAPTA